MKLTAATITGCCALILSFSIGAVEIKTVNYGAATVVYDFQVAGEEVATLSLNALVTETNDSLRALKNSDQRRLRKMGQLIYQCKLLLRRPAKDKPGVDADAPLLISRNYSLYTDVDLALKQGEQLGIKVRSQQPVDADSLFTTAQGGDNLQREFWANLGQDSAINLKQLDVNILNDADVIGTAENIDIILRFPIFQVQQSAQQWSYNFNLEDFRRAVRHADENCTLETLAELQTW